MKKMYGAIFALIVLISTNVISKNKGTSEENVNQVITMMFVTPPSGPDVEFVIDVAYNLDMPLELKTSGLSIRLHWNSNELGLTSISNVLSDKLLSLGEVQLDVYDYDNDYQTDVFQQFIWFDENTSWPAFVSSTTLLTATFKTSPYFSGAKINISQASKHPVTEELGTNYVWGFQADSMKIIVEQDAIFANPFETSTNPVFQNVFIGNSVMCSIDIDGDGTLNPFTDGVILKRYLGGITGTDLVENALSQNAIRTTPSQIINYLLSANCQKMLDIDINQAIEHGFDDELFVRFLFEISGPELTDSAIGNEAEQTAAPDISAWLQFYAQLRDIQLDANIQMGVQTFTNDGIIGITPTNNMLNTLVQHTHDLDGDPVYQINTTNNIPFDLEVVFPPTQSVNNINKALFPCSNSTYEVENCVWQIQSGVFIDGLLYYFNRLPGSSILPNGAIGAFLEDNLYINVSIKSSAKLTSSCDFDEQSCLNKKPVLFIHGYTLSTLGFGGTESTWNSFPSLMNELGFTPFEFRWRTNARFEDAAADLYEAISLIKSRTGQNPHIIAHSFGGILIRTLLQGMAYGNPDISDLVDKVVTVGTPHSGIADNDTCFNGKIFPKGQDTFDVDIFELCGQLTCHQTGENILGITQDFFDVENTGFFMTQLACPSTGLAGCSIDYPLEDVEMLVLLGMRKNKGLAHTGDGLITYEGQRFMPTYTKSGSCEAIADSPSDLGQNITFLSGAKIQEKMLDTNQLGVVPGDPVTFPFNNLKGFKHSALNGPQGVTHEVKIDCETADTCRHPTFIATRDFFEPDLNVSIEQAFDQADPTYVNSARFTIQFSKPINSSTFTDDDLELSTPTASKSLVASSPNNTEWILEITNLLEGDTVSVSMNAGQVEADDSLKTTNQTSTSNDNSVTYRTFVPTQLNDTGIIWSGNYEGGSGSTCDISATPQDCHFGRGITHDDDTNGHAGFNFTKIDSFGNELPSSALVWSCVRDNVTGLVWEIKTTDGGVHDADNLYRWGGLSANGRDHPNREGSYFDDWNSLIYVSILERLCGFDDWRVPTMSELISIANIGSFENHIETYYFPNDTGFYYWSSHPALNSDSAYRHAFSLRGSDIEFRSNRSHLRLVR